MKTQLTYEEIVERFKNDKELNDGFKALMLTRLSAMCQAMYNSTSADKEKTMIFTNTHGDDWQEEHNRFVTEYQRYHK
jgi:RecA-family ATPase